MPHGEQQNVTEPGRDNGTSTATDQNETTDAPLHPSQTFMDRDEMDQFVRSIQLSFEDRNGEDVSSLGDRLNDSLYARYKNCTHRFKQTLQSMVPAEIFQYDNVKALMNAAEYVAKNDWIKVEPPLLEDLKIAIRIRNRVALDQFDGGDDGHAYFNAILAYCWSILAPKLPRPLRVSKKPVATKKTSLANRFEGLSMADENSDDDEDEDLEEDLPSGPIARPDDAEISRLSLEQLISGSDRENAIIFLMTLDELMGCVSSYYSDIKTKSAWMLSEFYPENVVIGSLIEASIATNLAIQQVVFLEESFVHDHPHLNTVYRALACVLFTTFVPTVTSLVSKKSPLAAHFSEKDAIEFLGDALECAFRNASDTRNRQKVLVKEFIERWQFCDDASDDTTVLSIFEKVYWMVKVEVPIYQKQQDYESGDSSGNSGRSSHKWLNNFKYLGQDRSIVHTVRLLQEISSAYEGKGFIVPRRRPLFGPSWNERQGVSTRFQVDMDSLLMEEIMPSMLNMCRKGLLSYNLPYHEELLAAPLRIKRFVDNPEVPVTWSLAFAIHCILTSVFEVQGLNLPYDLAEISRNTYEDFFQRVIRAQNRTSAYGKIESVLNLEKLPTLMNGASESQDVLVSWNPLLAGSFLSYIVYYLNLHVGTKVIDARAQLRMALHLINALENNQTIQSGQIEPLDLLFAIFDDSKAVWEGPLPTRGQFQKRWLITCGVKAGPTNQRRKRTPTSTRRRKDDSRKVTPLLAEDISKSFRIICRRDFSDAVATNHSKRCSGGEADMHGARVIDISAAMQMDMLLLGANLIAIGYYLNQFFLDLFKEFGLMAKVNQLIQAGPQSTKASNERLQYYMSDIIAKHIFGPLDKGDVRIASRCAQCLEKRSLKNYLWTISCGILH